MWWTLSIIFYVLSMTLSTASVLFGVVSWILVKKWREYHNFVFVNFIIAGGIFLTWLYVWFYNTEEIGMFLVISFIIMLAHMQMTHWQLIATIMIYKDIVTVFDTAEVRCKYLLTNLFAWLLPIAEFAIMLCGPDFVIDLIVVALMEFAVFVASVVLYVRVLFVLVKLMVSRKITGRDLCGKLLVATLACVMAGLPPLLSAVGMIIWASDSVLFVLDSELAMIPNLLNILFANVFFLMMKSHRRLWTEYINKRREARAMRRDMEMQLSPRNTKQVISSPLPHDESV